VDRGVSRWLDVVRLFFFTTAAPKALLQNSEKAINHAKLPRMGKTRPLVIPRRYLLLSADAPHDGKF
jgi:hypothetical protein